MVENGDVDCVCPMKGLAERMAELSEDKTGIRRAVARDLSTGASSMVVGRQWVLFQRSLGGSQACIVPD